MPSEWDFKSFMYRVKDTRQLGSAEKAVLMVLGTHAAGDGTAYAAPRDIAYELSMSDKTAVKWLDLLEKSGWIKRIGTHRWEVSPGDPGAVNAAGRAERHRLELGLPEAKLLKRLCEDRRQAKEALVNSDSGVSRKYHAELVSEIDFLVDLEEKLDGFIGMYEPWKRGGSPKAG